MPSAPAMQREAVRTVIAVRPIAAALAVRTVAALAPLAPLRLVLLRLTAGNERRQPLDVAIMLLRRLLLRALLKVLRLRLMMLLMRLMLLLRLVLLMRLVVRLMAFTRIKRLRLTRGERLAAHGRLIVIAVIIAIVGGITAHIARLLLLLIIGLALPKLFLRSRDQTEIMFGVLIIIFGGDRVSRALRVAGELEIFFGNVRGGAPDFYVLPVGFVDARQWILVMMMPTFAIASAHAFVLTVSHVCCSTNPVMCGGTDAAASIHRFQSPTATRIHPSAASPPQIAAV